MQTPTTLTEAQSRNPFRITWPGGGAVESNARVIPYVERYLACTSVVKTPAERLQEAADEERRRDTGRQ